MIVGEPNANIGDVVFQWTCVLRYVTQYIPGLLLYPVLDYDDSLYYISEYGFNYIRDTPRVIRVLQVNVDKFLERVCQFDQSLDVWCGEFNIDL